MDLDALLPASLRDRYLPRRLLGEGGMGRVVEVEDRNLGRGVAIKLALPGLSDELRARFVREAEALAGFAHPAVPQVFDHGVADGHVYLVMELVDGEELSRSLALEARLAALVSVAGALEAVHDAGLVHRDVKPSNIVVPPQGSAKLIDFGLVSDPERTSLTRTGGVVGTFGYLAPEYLLGDGVSPAVDWYGWGASLFLMVEGRRARSNEDMFALARGAPFPPLEFQRLRHHPLRGALVALLDVDPTRRLEGARAAVRVLVDGPPIPDEEAAPGPTATTFRVEGGGASEGNVGPEPVASSDLSPTSPAGGPQDRKRSSPVPRWPLVLAASLGFFAWGVLSGGSTTPHTTPSSPPPGALAPGQAGAAPDPDLVSADDLDELDRRVRDFVSEHLPVRLRYRSDPDPAPLLDQRLPLRLARILELFSAWWRTLAPPDPERILSRSEEARVRAVWTDVVTVLLQVSEEAEEPDLAAANMLRVEPLRRLSQLRTEVVEQVVRALGALAPDPSRLGDPTLALLARAVSRVPGLPRGPWLRALGERLVPPGPKVDPSLYLHAYGRLLFLEQRRDPDCERFTTSMRDLMAWRLESPEADREAADLLTTLLEVRRLCPAFGAGPEVGAVTRLLERGGTPAALSPVHVQRLEQYREALRSRGDEPGAELSRRLWWWRRASEDRFEAWRSWREVEAEGPAGPDVEPRVQQLQQLTVALNDRALAPGEAAARIRALDEALAGGLDPATASPAGRRRLEAAAQLALADLSHPQGRLHADRAAALLTLRCHVPTRTGAPIAYSDERVVVPRAGEALADMVSQRLSGWSGSCAPIPACELALGQARSPDEPFNAAISDFFMAGRPAKLAWTLYCVARCQREECGDDLGWIPELVRSYDVGVNPGQTAYLRDPCGPLLEVDPEEFPEDLREAGRRMQGVCRGLDG